ncbi:Aste57867_18320 [Aphanomyces stellatus]|uniref:Aste57867_18320 protein n=1 Tax=Aphanomyces stellatus TaxID=120398 RepID=A0A485KHD4_9STRA|nr:hypothetical protein As57867_018258 [Aphanomyces stellatus]KAF0711090.1 hypothetical protein As57867_005376 [Aphanomyces stellatus]VFT82447.1 Aste57867_5389 [Aphanomyces stellatus]VFT95056.1 Aste57867_18320 [Aphanomyces stellatus]
MQASILQWVNQQRKPSTAAHHAAKNKKDMADEAPSKRMKWSEEFDGFSTDGEAGCSQDSIFCSQDSAPDDSDRVDLSNDSYDVCYMVDADTFPASESRLEARKMIKDSVHGCIYLEPICMAIIDTTHFQRLRHLKQLGATYFVYMGATHSRFEHSVGVAFLAESMLMQLRHHQPWLGIDDKDILCVKIAGLCHDLGNVPLLYMEINSTLDLHSILGHGPFSHVYDGIFMQQLQERGHDIAAMRGWTHEQGSLDVLDSLLQAHQIDLVAFGLHAIDYEFIRELILGRPLGRGAVFRGRPSKPFLYEVVNNSKTGLDVDKLDYFMRDAQYTGAKAGCDTHLLLSSARVLPDATTGQLTICWPEKMAEQIMKVFRTRYELHQAVYQHKATRAIEYMICDILLEADADFKIRGVRISQAPLHMEAYMCLDDRILALIESNENPALENSQSILKRIATKPLYKWAGTTQATAHSTALSEKQIKEEIVRCSNDALDLRQLIVEKNRVHFGQKDRDPLQTVRFFKKHATPSATCFQLHEVAYAMHCPRHFMESNVRLFVRDPEHLHVARVAFAKWSTECNGSSMYPQEE